MLIKRLFNTIIVACIVLFCFHAVVHIKVQHELSQLQITKTKLSIELIRLRVKQRKENNAQNLSVANNE